MSEDEVAQSNKQNNNLQQNHVSRLSALRNSFIFNQSQNSIVTLQSESSQMTHRPFLSQPYFVGAPDLMNRFSPYSEMNYNYHQYNNNNNDNNGNSQSAYSQMNYDYNQNNNNNNNNCNSQPPYSQMSYNYHQYNNNNENSQSQNLPSRKRRFVNVNVPQEKAKRELKHYKGTVSNKLKGHFFFFFFFFFF